MNRKGERERVELAVDDIRRQASQLLVNMWTVLHHVVHSGIGVE